MRYLITVTLIILVCSVFAQNKETIVRNQVKLKRSLEQDIDQGEKNLLLEKEEYFTPNGNLTELKEFDEKGRIKKWERYQYTSKGQLAQEEILNYKGEVKKRIEHVYQDGLKVGKLYYDDRNRLYKKKRYEFEYQE